MKEEQSIGPELAMNAFDNIPKAKDDARDIVGLIKSGGRITGYQLSDGTTVSKEDGVAMAKTERSRESASPTVKIVNI